MKSIHELTVLAKNIILISEACYYHKDNPIEGYSCRAVAPYTFGIHGMDENNRPKKQIYVNMSPHGEPVKNDKMNKEVSNSHFYKENPSRSERGDSLYFNLDVVKNNFKVYPDDEDMKHDFIIVDDIDEDTIFQYCTVYSEAVLEAHILFSYLKKHNCKFFGIDLENLPTLARMYNIELFE